MNIKSLLDLFNHMAWADAEVWKAVLACDEAREDVKLRGTLSHLHGVQRIYLRTWQGEMLDPSQPRIDHLPTLLEHAKANCGDVCAHVETLTDAQIHEPIPAAWAQRVEQWMGPARTMPTLGDTVLQVPLHSQYHRGQANARLRELGGTPPLVDYVAWVWLGRPEAAWPTAAD